MELKIGYRVYRIARAFARITRISGLIKASFGPALSYFMFKQFAGPRKSILVNDHWMTLSDEGQYPPFSMAADRYEIGTTNLLNEILKPGMVVIDIGAHVGYFTLLSASRIGPAGKVYSFEPEPSNYQLLKHNIEANHYQNVVAIQQAVSQTSGSGNLKLSSRDNGTHSFYGKARGNSEDVIVDVTSLDEFWIETGWPKIDLIKMDVEGAEMDALSGMAGVLKNLPDLRLIMEFNPTLLRTASVNPLEFLKKPEEFGFTVSVINDPVGTTIIDATMSISLTDALSRSENSINLYCLKR